MTDYRVQGPYFDDLRVGQEFRSAPAHTVTAGRQAVHQAIVGDRLRLALDDDLATRVAGAPLAHPALVWDVAIGQSTVVTQHVRANLFYRDLAFHRFPRLGDTLHTVTTVVGLRENTRREGRRPTGLAALRMLTTDQHGRTVLDFYRCAMLPLHDGADTGHRDDLTAIGAAQPPDPLAALVDLDLTPIPESTSLPEVGDRYEIVDGDIVSSAPELARLTLNIAAVHHDARAGGGARLVYGGHVVGIALSQVTRALPCVVTVPAWRSCDHLGPVHEGDTLCSTVEVEHAEPGPAAGTRILRLRSRVRSDAADVLDWRFVALAR